MELEARRDLAGVKVNLIEHSDEIADFKRWLGERHAGNAVALDLETSGLSPYDKGARIRLAQLGDAMTGWAIPWDLWPGLVIEALTEYDGPLILHNAGFDIKWMEEHSPWRANWARVRDTMLAARLVNPLFPAGLKPQSDRFIDRRASVGQKLLDEAFAKHGWTWDTVPVNFEPYWSYGALDTVLTVRLDEMYQPAVGVGAPYAEAFDLEMATLRITTRMEQKGALIDRDYCTEMYDKCTDYELAIKQWARENFGGIEIGSPARLARKFSELGAEISVFTEKGHPKVDKWQLKIFADPDNGYPVPAQKLAEQVLLQRKYGKLASSYFGNFISQNKDGIIHASINPMAARTGRMCLPTTHMLLTRRGPVPVTDIRSGDETINEFGEWTAIQEVYQYDDQPTLVWDHAYIRLESTAEHRWVARSERGRKYIEPFHDKGRRYLQLTPSGNHLDLTDLTISATTDSERFAALVGLLVSDGRAHQGANKGEGLRAFVYQTEGKFYRTILDVLDPTAIMYDRVTADTSSGPHHEIRIKTRWLRPRLDAAGLTVAAGATLRDSADLTAWVMGLSLREVTAFLQAIWLADGSTAHPENRVISCGSASLREAIQAAAYRCGYRSHIANHGRGEWSTTDRLAVKLTDLPISTRTFTQSESRADVWCVRTSSGTFTAWDPTAGPYLTGNSISNPALQQLPRGDAMVRDAFLARDGNVLLSTDFSQIEMRMMAVFSNDPELQHAFAEADETGGDFFVTVGREVYREPGFAKGDKRRNLIKSTMYGMAYGAGVAKMAETAGVPVERMKDVSDALTARYPGIKNFMRQVEDVGKRREFAEGEGYVNGIDGRRLPCDTGRVYTLVNYLIQGGAAVIYKRALSRLDAAGYGDTFIIPVHDEIVMDIPKEDAPDAMVDVPRIMQDDSMAVAVPADMEGPFDRWGSKYRGK